MLFRSVHGATVLVVNVVDVVDVVDVADVAVIAVIAVIAVAVASTFSDDTGFDLTVPVTMFVFFLFEVVYE